MKQDQNPETPNVCNNCIKPEKKPADEVNILITCARKTQIEIEEICINQGVSFSQYFLSLHGLNLIDLKMEGEKTDKEFLKRCKNEKTDAKLPEGFGEVNLPEAEEPSRTNTTPEPIELKKRGRPFKNH